MNRLLKKYIPTFFFALFCFLCVSLILQNPEQTFQASLQGLSIWWKIVFPALLPFLVLTEFAVSYGFLHGLGRLISPLTNKLFRISGTSAWVILLGLIAGAPTGAHATAKLRQNGQISRNEGEQLLALSHLSSPVLFVLIIGVGFFQQAQLGFVLLCIHFIAALLTGVFLRFHAKQRNITNTTNPIPKNNHLHASFQHMERARLLDGRTFGQILGDAVQKTIQNLFVIGGLMITFAVFITLLEKIGRLNSLYPSNNAVLVSLFELHLGAEAFSTQSPFLSVRAGALLSACIAFSGFSLILQVKHLIQGTDLRFSRFIFARLIHATFAFLCTFLLWQPLQRLFQNAEPASFLFRTKPHQTTSFFSAWSISLKMVCVWILIMICLLLIALINHRIYTLLCNARSTSSGTNSDTEP